MARPRKDSIVEEALKDPEPIMPPIKPSELKNCPKCGAKARAPYRDMNGNWRCHCDDLRCGFWDSIVSMSEEAAAQSWQLAGGPDPDRF